MNSLAIVGTGTQTRADAPFDDPSFDIWCFNESAGGSEWLKRWDVLFQMHSPEIYTAFNRKHAGHWEWLQEKHGKPIYMQAVDPRVPDSIAYPLDDAINLVGVRYLTATVCYALALAALKGYARVDIYGIEMSHSEYQYQAECYRFWLGFLKGRGIEVNLKSGMPLFETLLYGYEGNIGFGAEFFRQRAAELDKEWNLADSNARSQQRSILRLIDLKKTNQVGDAIGKYGSLAQECGEIAGRLAEAERYADLGDSIADRGGFEYAAAKAQKDGEAARLQRDMTFGKCDLVGALWAQTKQDAWAQQLIPFVRKFGEQCQEVGALLGVYHENIGYIKDYDKRALAIGVTQAGNK